MKTYFEPQLLAHSPFVLETVEHVIGRLSIKREIELNVIRGRPQGWCTAEGTANVIHLWLLRETYPVDFSGPDNRGYLPVTVNSFEETVVFLVAHEIRHCHQFDNWSELRNYHIEAWHKRTNKTYLSAIKRLMETDADAFGIGMLENYRALTRVKRPGYYSLAPRGRKYENQESGPNQRDEGSRQLPQSSYSVHGAGWVPYAGAEAGSRAHEGRVGTYTSYRTRKGVTCLSLLKTTFQI